LSCKAFLAKTEGSERGWVGPGKKKYNPWKKNLSFLSPLTPGKKIYNPWKRNLSTPPCSLIYASSKRRNTDLARRKQQQYSDCLAYIVVACIADTNINCCINYNAKNFRKP